MGVQIVQRWILAALRHRTFFSLGELNAAIALLLERLNARAFRKLPGSRRSLFEQLDRPALRPLPTERYLDLRAVGASHDIAKLAGTPAAAVLCGIPARGSLAVEAQSALEAHALPVAPVSRSLRRSEEVLSRCALRSSRCPYMHVRAAWA